jgi:hypothetical protein
MRRIGILLNAAADDLKFQAWGEAFLQALALLGWTIGLQRAGKSRRLRLAPPARAALLRSHTFAERSGSISSSLLARPDRSPADVLHLHSNLLCNSSVGIRQGTSIGDRDEKVPLSLGHAHALSTRSDRPHPGSSRDRPLSPLVHILRSQRRRELWLCFIRAMQVDGGGEHGHLHAQWAVSAAKHPTTTVEDRAHRSKPNRCRQCC